MPWATETAQQWGAGGTGIQIELDATQVANLVDFLWNRFPRQAPRVISQALNASIRTARTEASRAIRADIPIKHRDLVHKHQFGIRGRAPLYIRYADRRTLQADLRITGRRIPVVFLDARQRWESARKRAKRSGWKTTRFRRYRAGVSWRSRTGGARAYERMAFFGRGRRGGSRQAGTGGVAELGTSGHMGVYKRRGKKRLPIVELKGPSIPWVAQRSRRLRQAIVATDGAVRKRLEERLKSNIEMLLEREVK